MMVFFITVAYIVACIPVFHLLSKLMKEEEIGEGEIKRKLSISLGIIAALTLFFVALNIWAESLWFAQMGYSHRFWKELGTKWAIFASIGSIIFFLLWLNLLGLKKVIGPDKSDETDRDELKRFNRIAYAVIASIALFAGIGAAGKWPEFLLYFNQVKTGTIDPIFHKDIGFYLFSLPVFNYLNGLLFAFLIGAGVIIALICFVYDETEVWARFKNYLWSWGIGFFALLAWKLALGKYNLLFTGGTVYGAGYTDVHLRIPAINIMIALTIIACMVFLIAVFWQKMQSWKNLIGAFAFIGVVALISCGIVPGIYQHVSVKPNWQKERPYIGHEIQMTRDAYDLNKVENKEFTYQPTLTAEMLTRNQETLDNIRVWDWRPLLNSYQQKQRFTLYYEFPDIDIDRYMVNGHYRQIMMGLREIDKSTFDSSAQTWVNMKLKYTHGYGIALNQVNEFGAGGEPIFLIKDIPPQSSVEEIKISRPEIYYGLLTNDHVYVRTNEQEFDYPGGDRNFFCDYEGTGGVEIGSGLRKLALALKFDKEKLYFSEAFRPDSRVMFHRQVEERLEKLAPWLRYDNDVYHPIDNQGKIWWLADAYTVSSRYPYSRPYTDKWGRLNYIRNSVKAEVDPYNGTVTFYVFDENDPIIRAWQKAFPGFFKAKHEMPPDLMSQIRYPEDFLLIQARVYCTYHMSDPEKFYNKEDMWSIAEEVYSLGKRQEILPFYVVIRLPGESDVEFIQMIPFVPRAEERNNLVGWLAGRCDGEEYGKLIAYSFPKQLLVQGPMQFEARIDQNEVISERFSLWGQMGSDVIRGNTLIVPIENSILYVEPIYLKAEQSEMPEIRRIIVGSGDKIAWGITLEEALNKLVSTTPYVPPVDPEMPEYPKEIKELILSAQYHFSEYQRLTGEGKLAEAGSSLKKLEEILNEIFRLSKEEG